MFKQMNEIQAARNLKLNNEIIEKPFNLFFSIRKKKKVKIK